MIDSIKMHTASNEWINGFPVGSGRIAAMISSGENCDVITLNHEWLWRGDTDVPRTAYHSAEYLPMVRSLLDKEDFYRATGIAGILFGGYGTGSALKNNMDGYQYAGILKFEYTDDCTLIERNLNLEHGIAIAERKGKTGDLHFESFCDCIHDVFIAHWFSAEKFFGRLCFFKEIQQAETGSCVVCNNTLIYDGSFSGGTSFQVNVHLCTDGNINTQDNGWIIGNATYVKVFCNIGCSASPSGIDAEIKKHIADLSAYEAIKINHCKKFSSFMRRIDIQIGNCSKSALYLEDRMSAVRLGENDPGLFKIIYDFARYLMISCSITADLPINLQGKWNCYDNAPWNSDYHYDINLQMCYWIAESAALGECADVLMDYLVKRMPAAKVSARNIYGCRGIYFPLADDVWGQCTPESTHYGAWIGAAPWLAQHLWWHYIYSGDLYFLKHTAYEFFKEVAVFYEDYLCIDANGTLQIYPSQSPENHFKEHDRESYGQPGGSSDYRVSICKSSAMDIELANDAFDYAIKSAEILGIDAEHASIWKKLKNDLPKISISSDGRIVEWDDEKRQETDLGHKHLSHLYGLYPSEQLTEDKDKQLFHAAVKSLYTRLDHSSAFFRPGWGEAWAACMLARTKDQYKLSNQLHRLLKNCFMDNLLDLHPNFDSKIKSKEIFQIDGNLGTAAAVTEAIASYWGGKLHLLHNLPDGWSDGHLFGLKIPGGHTVNVEWQDQKVTKLEIIIGFTEDLIVDVNGTEMQIHAKSGDRAVLMPTIKINNSVPENIATSSNQRSSINMRQY